MKKHYIGGVEVPEAEALALVGDKTTREYIRRVYRGALGIDAVPVELRDQVRAAVEARTARSGAYGAQEISAQELKCMIEEAM